MNIKKRSLSCCLLLSFLLLFGSSIYPVSTYAQEGEGVSACDYYTAYKFNSKQECESYVYSAQEKALSEGAFRIVHKCLLASGFQIGAAQAMKILSTSPQAALAQFGIAFISCVIAS